MSYIRLEQRSFSQGELGPYMNARSDTKMYPDGLHATENWWLLPQGALNRRPGFMYIDQVLTGPPEVAPDTCTLVEPGALVINDTFTDTDDTLLEDHTGETGVKWVNAYTSYYGVTTGRIQINDDQANGQHATVNYGGLYVATTASLDGDFKIASTDIIGPAAANYVATVDIAFLSVAPTQQNFTVATAYDTSTYGRLQITGSNGDYFLNCGSAAPQVVPVSNTGFYTLIIQVNDGTTCYYVQRSTDTYWFDGHEFQSAIHSAASNVMATPALSLVKYSDTPAPIHKYCALQLGMYPGIPQAITASNFKVYSL